MPSTCPAAGRSTWERSGGRPCGLSSTRASCRRNRMRTRPVRPAVHLVAKPGAARVAASVRADQHVSHAGKIPAILVRAVPVQQTLYDVTNNVRGHNILGGLVPGRVPREAGLDDARMFGCGILFVAHQPLYADCAAAFLVAAGGILDTCREGGGVCDLLAPGRVHLDGKAAVPPGRRWYGVFSVLPGVNVQSILPFTICAVCVVIFLLLSLSSDGCDLCPVAVGSLYKPPGAVCS